MLRALWTGYTGMRAQSMALDLISHNLANVGTTGFKNYRFSFQDLLYQKLPSPEVDGVQGNPELAIGTGVRLMKPREDFSQGNMFETGAKFDLAIAGTGLFEVELPGGEKAYTRDGSFTLDADGYLVTKSGLFLTSRLQIPDDATELGIRPDGSMVYRLPDGSMVEAGQIEVFLVREPSLLRPIGGNLHMVTGDSGPAVPGIAGEGGRGTISQGFVELSNVKLVDEMTTMLRAQRAYQFGSRAVQVADEMWELANNLRR